MQLRLRLPQLPLADVPSDLHDQSCESARRGLAFRASRSLWLRLREFAEFAAPHESSLGQRGLFPLCELHLEEVVTCIVVRQ